MIFNYVALFSTKKFRRLVKSRIASITINEVPAMKKRKNRCYEFKSKEKMWAPEGFLGRSVVNNPPANAGDTGSIPGLRIASGKGNDNPLQYSCLGNLMDRGAWWATVHGVRKRHLATKCNNNNAQRNWKRIINTIFGTCMSQDVWHC